MKRSVVLLVAVVFGIGAAGLAVAQTPSPAPAPAPATTPAPAQKPVDTKQKVDSKTAIRKSQKAITATDLKPGDQVQVRYMDQAGKATAVTIQVKSGAAAAKSTGQPAEKK